MRRVPFSWLEPIGFLIGILFWSGWAIAMDPDSDVSMPRFFELPWTLEESRLWEAMPRYFLISTPVMDVNRDGLPDLILAGPLFENGWVDEEVPVRWVENLGDGEFAFGSGASLPSSAMLTHVRQQHVADFNQDGFDDYVGVGHGYDVEPFEGERNLLLISQPNGSIADIGLGDDLFDYGGFTHALDVGDINGDDIADIVTIDLGLFDPVQPPGGNFRLLVNDGSAGFSRVPTDFPNPNVNALSVKLVDLNGDGFDEMVAGGVRNLLSDLQDLVFWNDGQGGYDFEAFTVLPEYHDDEGIRYGDTLAIETIDIDFDDDLDLVLSKSNSYVGKTLRFLINNGDRTFSDETSAYAALTEQQWDEREGIPYWLRVVDLNNDGLKDLFLEYDSPVYEHHSLFWLRKPGGAFLEYPTTRLHLQEHDAGPFTLENRFWLWPVDQDQDGDLDIVIRYQDTRPGSIDENGQPTIRWRILSNETLNGTGVVMRNSFE